MKPITITEDNLKLELKVVLTILILVAGVIAAHFAGVASAERASNTYTDKKILEIREEQKDYKAMNERNVDRILNKLDDMNSVLLNLTAAKGAPK